MPSAADTKPATAVLSALRWVAVTIGCLFAADTALDGETRGVFAVGIAVLVAVWWTLRPQLIQAGQDASAAIALVGADLLSGRAGAFVPAIAIALVPVLGRRWFEAGPDDEVVSAADRLRPSRPVSQSPSRQPPVEPREPVDVSAEIVAEERRRAGRLHERVTEWLTYVQIALDRHLTRRPDYQLAKLRDEITESIREVEERSRQLRARVTPTAPLSSHAGRLLEWWSHHHGSDVTLRITDPDASLDPAIEQQLLTILQEAVENVGRHAEAEHVTVRWDIDGSTATLVVEDDGCGFERDSVDGRGLAAMARAAQRAGARLDISSTVGEGTTVTATVPN